MSGSEGGGFFGGSPPLRRSTPVVPPPRRSQALLGNALARSSASHFSDLTPDFWVRLRWGGAKQSLAGRIPKQSLGTTRGTTGGIDSFADSGIRRGVEVAKQSLARRIPKQSLGTTRSGAWERQGGGAWGRRNLRQGVGDLGFWGIIGGLCALGKSLRMGGTLNRDAE